MKQARPSDHGLAGHTVLVAALIGLPGFAVLKAALVIAYSAYALATARVTLPGAALTFSVVGSLVLGWLVSRAGGVPSGLALDQFSRLAIFYGIFLCAFRLKAFSTPFALDRLGLYAAGIAAATKIGIMVLVVGLDVDFEVIQSWLGFETVTQMIGFNLQRLQFPADFAIFFLVSCYAGGRSRWRDALFLASIAVVVMLSFSRFIFVCFFAAVFVRAVWTGRLDFMPKLGLALALVLALVFSESLTERFASEGTDASDDARAEQIDYLAEQAQVAPVLGHGLGYAVPGYLRSESQPYSYEMQWYATLMQLGWVGVAWLVLNVVLLTMLPVRDKRSAACAAILLGVWALSGFANPYLTSLGTALGFAVTAWRIRIAFRHRPRPEAVPSTRKGVNRWMRRIGRKGAVRLRSEWQNQPTPLKKTR